MPRFAPWYRRDDYALVREGRRGDVPRGRRMPKANGAAAKRA